MIYYFVTAKTAYAMGMFLESWGKSLAGKIRIVEYEALLSGQKSVPEIGGAYIFNNIARLRQLPPAPRKVIYDLHERLIKNCGPNKVLNDPTKALLRYDFLRAMHKQGVNSFNVYRAGNAPRRFPVFVRHVNDSEFETPRLCATMREYHATIAGIRSMRKPLDDLIVIEFVDTKDANGVYRKYGAFVVGGRVVPRHLFFSRNWMVKLADLAEPPMIEEEMNFLNSTAHAALLHECARINHTHYCRIDYGLLDGRPQIWEVNLNPMLASAISSQIPARRPAHLKFVAMISDAFAALDS
jgi:hypothetical protein